MQVQFNNPTVRGLSIGYFDGRWCGVRQVCNTNYRDVRAWSMSFDGGNWVTVTTPPLRKALSVEERAEGYVPSPTHGYARWMVRCDAFSKGAEVIVVWSSWHDVDAPRVADLLLEVVVTDLTGKVLDAGTVPVTVSNKVVSYYRRATVSVAGWQPLVLDVSRTKGRSVATDKFWACTGSEAINTNLLDVVLGPTEKANIIKQVGRSKLKKNHILICHRGQPVRVMDMGVNVLRLLTSPDGVTLCCEHAAGFNIIDTE